MTFVVVEPGHWRLAAATLRFAPPSPTHWYLALTPGQDPDSLKPSEYYGYIVDSGLGCFMDSDTARLLNQRMARLDGNYYDDVLAPELDDADFLLHRPAANEDHTMAIFSSGWGDGFYASYWGFAESGAPVALNTDFAVVPLSHRAHEGG